MKFDIVTQWVRADHGSSPTWPKRSQQVSSEVHVQAQQWEYEAGWIEGAGCVLSPEIDLVVVKRIISLFIGRGKPTLCIQRKAAVLGALWRCT